MKVQNSRLQVRFILALVLFSTLMTALVGALEMAGRLQAGLAEINVTFNQYRESQGPTLAQNLWRMDDRSLEIQMRSMLNNPNILAVEVSDELGGVRKVGDLKTSGSVVSVEYPIFQAGAGGGAAVGTLKLYGTDAQVRKTIAAELPWVLLSELAKAAASAVFLLVIFYRLFGRPLNRVIAYTDHLSPETLADTLDLQRRRDPQHPDELDRLAEAVNGMAYRIRDDLAERRQAQAQIAAKNKELEQIVYVASHDLRSPLVNVDGYSREIEYLVRQIGAILDSDENPGDALTNLLQAERADLTQSLAYIRNSTRQMDKLLKGLLELSRSGRASLQISALDMDDLAAKVVGSFEFQIRQLGVSVDVGPLPRCLGDEVQVTQVLANLLGNALKYREPGRALEVRISGDDSGTQAVYCVEDNGIGIAPEHQEKIFELFHRLNPGATEGEGLGLTVVRQILGRLGGSVQVESETGRGSRFLVTLPKPSGGGSR